MKPVYKETIKAMCDCDMIMYKAAQKLYLNPGSVIHRVRRIEELYGLSPRKYRDLVKLEKIAEEEDDNPSGQKKYCAQCNQEITKPRNTKFCSKECSNKYWATHRPFR